VSGLTKLEENIPALRRYAWTLLRNQSDADDLVQDCLVRALDHMDQRTSENDMRPWLFSIMHNLCVSRWRRLRFRSSIVVSDTEADVSVPASQETAAELHAALNGLDQLPEEQRQVLLLVAVEGLEYADVAKILKIPVGTVMSRLSRARDKLRDTMEGRQRPTLRRVK
jgi:RNA polymerase sigma-70 factor (ECF subfamily)